ncbi:hypothetical protein KP509_27G016300 [Ceratopteris richardii]|nr:hypothetical protein KP509_27G016300 [Ceratopteris richardii]
MKGLPEEVSQSSDGLEASQEHSLLVSSATVRERSAADSFERIGMSYTIDAYSDSIATKVKHRSFSYDHIISMEVTNLVYFTERYMEFLPSKSLNKAWSMEKEVNVETHPTTTNFPSTMVDKVIKLEGGDDFEFSAPICSDSDNCIPAVENTSVGAPDWLQTSLSFKYMLDNSSSEDQTIPQKPLDIEVNEAFQCHSENLVFPTSLSSCMSEYINSSFNQKFSAVTSWKDRPCSTDPLFRSLGELVCDNVISHRLSLECQDDPKLNSSEDSIFDPQLVDTFENSLRHLSKEEWDALRTMEDSPHKFLHSIQVLRKSCSSSARKQEDKGLYLSITSTNRRTDEHTNGRFESEKTQGSKEFTDKLQAFMRQSSLEVKRASSNARFTGAKSRVSVVFYSTTQDGSKAFKDCNRVRSILKSLVGTYYDERSVSEREEHGQELRGALNITRLIVPTLYVEGKYLVGIESILHLNKRGRLSSILGKVIVSG